MAKRESRKDEGVITSGLMPLQARPQGSDQSAMAEIEEHADWPLLQKIPLLMAAGVPLPKFRVRDLLALKPGQTIESLTSSSGDVPVKVGAVQFGWTELELVGQRMAVRLTRLA